MYGPGMEQNGYLFQAEIEKWCFVGRRNGQSDQPCPTFFVNLYKISLGSFVWDMAEIKKDDWSQYLGHNVFLSSLGQNTLSILYMSLTHYSQWLNF